MVEYTHKINELEFGIAEASPAFLTDLDHMLERVLHSRNHLTWGTFDQGSRKQKIKGVSNA